MRKVLFRRPFGVWRDGKSQYMTMINGVWIYGEYSTLMQMHDEAKKKYLKEKVRVI